MTLATADSSQLAVHVVPPPPPDGRGASGGEGRAPARWPESIGQVGGLAVEEDGRHVWVFHRGGRTWTGESFNTVGGGRRATQMRLGTNVDHPRVERNNEIFVGAPLPDDRKKK